MSSIRKDTNKVVPTNTATMRSDALEVADNDISQADTQAIEEQHAGNHQHNNASEPPTTDTREGQGPTSTIYHKHRRTLGDASAYSPDGICS